MPSANTILREILKKSTTASLSELLLMAQRFAQEIGERGLEKWVRLEVGGYHGRNPVITDDVRVPDYRSVPGQHSDDYGRPLVITNSDLGFINEYRLQEGVAELEVLSKSPNSLTIRNPSMIKGIRDNLKVDVSLYSFSPASVSSVLNNIRSELINRLYYIKSKRGVVLDENDNTASFTPSPINIENFQGVLGNINGSTVNQSLHMTVKKGDLSSLKRYLVSNGVEEHEVLELETAIKTDPTPKGSKNLGEQVSVWVGKMIQKAANGGWQIGIGAAGGVLSEAISAFYGL